MGAGRGRAKMFLALSEKIANPSLGLIVAVVEWR